MTKYLKTDWDYDSEKLVEVFDELPLWAAPFGLKLLDAIKYRKGLNVLDIGFGAGFPLTEIAMRLDNSSKVYGIDPWESAINRAKKKVSFFGIENIEIIKGQAEDIPLNKNTIDLVVSNNGINNVADIGKCLAECSRIMKTGGQFVQTVNLNKTMHEFYTCMGKVLKDVGLDDCINAMHHQIYEKRKPLDEYLAQIESHNFSITSVNHDQFEMKYADGSSMLNHYFIRMAFMDGWKSIVPGKDRKEVFERIEKELNNIAEVEGYLKLTVPFVLIDAKKN